MHELPRACCEACKLYGEQAEPLPASLREPQRALARIQVHRAGKLLWEVATRGAVVTVGRAADCDVQIADATISRRQCQLTVEPGGVVLADLRSACGTFLDGQAIDRAPVPVDAEIRVGDYVLRLLAS